MKDDEISLKSCGKTEKPQNLIGISAEKTPVTPRRLATDAADRSRYNNIVRFRTLDRTVP